MRASVATHARADASSYASRAMSRSKSSPPRTSGRTIANSRGPSKMSSSGATCGCIGSAERIASSARIARSRTAAQSALSMSLTATSARGRARARAACTRVEPPRPMHGPSSYSSARAARPRAAASSSPAEVRDRRQRLERLDRRRRARRELRLGGRACRRARLVGGAGRLVRAAPRRRRRRPASRAAAPARGSPARRARTLRGAPPGT